MTTTTLQESPAPYGVALARAAEIGEQRVLLHNVSWATYKALLKDLGDSRSCRLAFDSGELEIMSPHIPHENSQISLGQMVIILAEELGIPCRALGSWTCERADLQKGIEADGCFYIKHARQVRGLQKIDLDISPPPDLMIEVDFSTDSRNKLHICAALGVPEHWRFNGSVLEIRVLKSGRYFDAFESLAFPGIPLANEVARFVQISNDDLTSMNYQFRKWVRQELRKQTASIVVKKSRRRRI